MELIMIRHGEPDYDQTDSRGFVGQGRDMAPLTANGVTQAEAAAEDPRLEGVELILSSPYTRALQTAAIISRKTGIPLAVEVDLHELICDKTFRLGGAEAVSSQFRALIEAEGTCPPDAEYPWETIDEISIRTKAVLDRYLALGYQKIAVVAHGGVIRRFTGIAQIAHCSLSVVDYHADFICFGWV